MAPAPAKQASDTEIPGLYSSEHITLNVPAGGDGARPPPVKYMYVLSIRPEGCPAGLHPANPHPPQVYPRIPQSPTTPQARCLFHAACQGLRPLPCFLRLSGSLWRQETLNARSEYSNSEDDGTAQHRINQYLIKQEIGRGSFGAVHLAVDQYGQEYVRNLLIRHAGAIEESTTFGV